MTNIYPNTPGILAAHIDYINYIVKSVDNPWSGVNHADSETLTLRDTYIMQEIQRGDWSELTSK